MTAPVARDAWKDWCEGVTLPADCEWGEWSGTYRLIMRDGREVCRCGGVQALVDSRPETMQAVVNYEIAKWDRIRARQPA